MTPDFRAMCVELVDALDSGIPAGRIRMSPLADRARTLLAQPEAEGPSKEELREMLNENDWNYISSETFEDIARTVLAQWGRPTPQPVAVSERLPSAADCDVEDNCWWFDPHADGAWYVDTFQSCYTHWLPSSALPLPVDS